MDYKVTESMCVNCNFLNSPCPWQMHANLYNLHSTGDYIFFIYTILFIYAFLNSHLVTVLFCFSTSKRVTNAHSVTPLRGTVFFFLIEFPRKFQYSVLRCFFRKWGRFIRSVNRRGRTSGRLCGCNNASPSHAVIATAKHSQRKLRAHLRAHESGRECSI